MADDAFAAKLAELASQFRAQLAPRIAEMQRLAAGGAFAEVRDLAHQLAGRGGTFGAPEITAAARGVEEASDAELPAALAALAATAAGRG